MSTASQIVRARAAAAAGAVINPGSPTARGDDNLTARLPAAKATTTAAVEMARQAVAAAQAVAATVVALRVKIERGPSGGSRSPAGHHPQSPSLERHHGCNGHSPVAQPVVQTVYRDLGAGTPWPMLTKSNYHEWILLMKVKLQLSISGRQSTSAASATMMIAERWRRCAPLSPLLVVLNDQIRPPIKTQKEEKLANLNTYAFTIDLVPYVFRDYCFGGHKYK